MAIAGGIGCRLALADVPTDVDVSTGLTGLPRDLVLATSESPTRFVCEVTGDNAAAFETLFADLPHACCGETCTRQQQQCSSPQYQRIWEKL
jgi:hypothetical protein